MGLKKLTNKSHALKGEQEKREYSPWEDRRVGRDGQRRLVEKYGNEAIASFRNNAESVIVFLEHLKPMANPLNDPVRKNAKATVVEASIDAGIRRFGVAAEYAVIKYLAQSYTALKSPDWLQENSGGGFGSKSPSEISWKNMKLVNQIEPRMPMDVRRALEACFVENVYYFDIEDESKRGAVLERLRLGLDIIAVEWREMEHKEFKERWPNEQT